MRILIVLCMMFLLLGEGVLLFDSNVICFDNSIFVCDTDNINTEVLLKSTLIVIPFMLLFVFVISRAFRSIIRFCLPAIDESHKVAGYYRRIDQFMIDAEDNKAQREKLIADLMRDKEKKL